MVDILQPSFANGEVGDQLYGRVDLNLYATSLREAKNFIIKPYGGAWNRPGTKFVSTTKTFGKRIRLIPFRFSVDQSYVLEFGENYFRIYDNGEVAVLPSTPAAYNALTVYGIGETVSSSGVNYVSITINNVGHTPASSPTYWRALSGLVMEFWTPYTEQECQELDYDQLVDVLYLTHPNHAPLKVSRVSATRWTTGDVVFENGPFGEYNTDTANTITVTGTLTHGSFVTLTSTLPGTFTDADSGSLFYIEQQDFDKPWKSAEAVLIGNLRRYAGRVYSASINATTGTTPPDFEGEGLWDDGAVKWAYVHSGWGILRLSTPVTLGGTVINAEVISRIPDGLVGTGSSKWRRQAFGRSLVGGLPDYPGLITFFQQRMVLASSRNRPQTVWLSRSGLYTDFGETQPLIDSDSITFDLASKQLNKVTGLLGTQRLYVLTSDGEFVVGSGDQDALTPTNLGAQQIGFRGGALIQPIGIGDTGLYIERDGRTVRDIGSQSSTSPVASMDLSIKAFSLMEGNTIVDWAFHKVPHECVWMARSDGTLLGLTYVREQQVVAWHHHAFGGKVESVACINDGDEDYLYLVSNRNGTRRIERMETRVIGDQRYMWFVDSGLKGESLYAAGSVSLIFTGTAPWDKTTTVGVQASSPIFTSSDYIGDHIVYKENGITYKFKIESITDTYNVVTTPVSMLPDALRGITYVGPWEFAHDKWSGLTHLEGETVSILADGKVHPQRTVVGGAVTLQYPAAVVVIGLPKADRLQTLDMGLSAAPTMTGKKKTFAQVFMRVRNSRGIKAGYTYDKLEEANPRAISDGYDIPGLDSGVVEITCKSSPETEARVCIEQPYPLPVEILGIMPDVDYGR